MRVIVVGGGVMGMCCALRMARRGVGVTLFEMRAVGGGASGAAIGALWPGPPLARGGAHPIHRRSLAGFEEFVRGVERDSGVAVSFRRGGRVEILDARRDVARAEAEARGEYVEWEGMGEPWEGARLEMISKGEILRMLPGFGGEQFGGMLCGVTEAQVDVVALMRALAGACVAAGVRIVVGREVTEVFSGGVVVGGERVEGGKVLVTAGAWTRRLLGGVRIRPVKGQAIALERPRGFLLERVVKFGGSYVVSWEEEILVGATTEAGAGFDERVTEEGREELRGRVVEMFPELSGARVLRQWAGLRPDGRKHLPTMGEVGRGSGIFVCAGHYKMGIGIASGVSELMGRLIVDGGSVAELEPFAP